MRDILLKDIEKLNFPINLTRLEGDQFDYVLSNINIDPFLMEYCEGLYLIDSLNKNFLNKLVQLNCGVMQRFESLSVFVATDLFEFERINVLEEWAKNIPND